MKNQMPSRQKAAMAAMSTPSNRLMCCVQRKSTTDTSQNQKWLKMWVMA